MHMTTLVHKKDCEGALTINTLTGGITTPLMDRPDWSEGLVLADLAERLEFYSSRLGDQFAQEHKTPQAIAFEDLGWHTVAEDGETLDKTEADTEFRQTVLAEVLGMNRPNDLSIPATVSNGKVLAEVELSLDRERTPQEIAAFQNAQREAFEKQHATG